MNVFDSLRSYAASWSVKSSRGFQSEEIQAVKKAEVVPSDFGNSVCFTMVSGAKKYIPLDRDSTLSVGDSVDLSKVELLTLSREGSSDIIRVRA